jgi:hypothetical protein
MRHIIVLDPVIPDRILDKFLDGFCHFVVQRRCVSKCLRSKFSGGSRPTAEIFAVLVYWRERFENEDKSALLKYEKRR